MPNLSLPLTLKRPPSRFAFILRRIAIALGILHLGLMYVFLTGPELSPLGVYLVDFPVAFPLAALLPGECLALGLAMHICSIVYPIAIYGMMHLIFRKHMYERPPGNSSVSDRDTASLPNKRLAARGVVCDARGRITCLFNPFALSLWHDRSPWLVGIRRTLRRPEGKSRRVLNRLTTIIVVAALAWIVLDTVLEVTGDVRLSGAVDYGTRITIASRPTFVTCMLAVLWAMRRPPRARVRGVMLAAARCPTCAYDLRKLPPDPTDGLTLCPECGSAWLLGT